MTSVRFLLAQGTRSALFAISIGASFKGLVEHEAWWGGPLWGFGCFVALQAACSYIRAAIKEAA